MGTAAPVVVRITLDGDAQAPSIHLDQASCSLAPGGRLRWIATGPQARQLAAVEFPGASPSAGGEPRLDARDEDGRREIWMTASEVGERTRFKYSVRAGASLLDPDIIIDPALRQR